MALLCSTVLAAANSPVADAAMKGDRGGAIVTDAEGGRKRAASRWRHRAPVGGLRNDTELADILIAAGATC